MIGNLFTGLAIACVVVAVIFAAVWLGSRGEVNSDHEGVDTRPDQHANCRCLVRPVFSEGSNTPPQVTIESPPRPAAPVDFHYYDLTFHAEPLPPYCYAYDRASDICHLGRLNATGDGYEFNGETVTVMPDLWEGDQA